MRERWQAWRSGGLLRLCGNDGRLKAGSEDLRGLKSVSDFGLEFFWEEWVRRECGWQVCHFGV
jgi:hypothetical protein